MPLDDLTSAEAIRKAVAEYDSLGQAAFLAKYNFGPARRYFLELNGRQYDSKAIVGAAHRIQFPEREALRSADFSGGDRTVRAKLESLGFTLVVLPSPSGTGTA
jgi:hypothetical protein